MDGFPFVRGQFRAHAGELASESGGNEYIRWNGKGCGGWRPLPRPASDYRSLGDDAKAMEVAQWWSISRDPGRR